MLLGVEEIFHSQNLIRFFQKLPCVPAMAVSSGPIAVARKTNPKAMTAVTSGVGDGMFTLSMVGHPKVVWWVHPAAHHEARGTWSFSPGDQGLAQPMRKIPSYSAGHFGSGANELIAVVTRLHKHPAMVWLIDGQRFQVFLLVNIWLTNYRE